VRCAGGMCTTVVMIRAKQALEAPSFNAQQNTASFVKTNGTLTWAQVRVVSVLYIYICICRYIYI
jgi:hypothetical protein